MLHEVIGKIRSHEMFLMGEVDPPNAKKDLALKAKSLVKIQAMRIVILSLHFS